MSTSLKTHELKHTSLLFPPLALKVCLNSLSIELAMKSNQLILCCLLLLLPTIFHSIRVFFPNELALCINWPKYWSFSSVPVFPMNIQHWFPLGLSGLIFLLSKRLWRVFSSTTIQKHEFFGSWSSLWCNSHILIWLLEKP